MHINQASAIRIDRLVHADDGRDTHKKWTFAAMKRKRKENEVDTNDMAE